LFVDLTEKTLAKYSSGFSSDKLKLILLFLVLIAFSRFRLALDCT